MTEWVIRIADPEDASVLADLEASAFGPASWGRQAVAEGITAPHVTTLLAAASEGEPAEGFVLWRQLADEAELLTIGVLPGRRRQGMARSLLRKVIADARLVSIRRLFLEVDAGNAPALELYEDEGFEPAGRRPRYYQNGADAVVLCKAL